MENENLIIELLKENREDIKENRKDTKKILTILPTLQTKENCKNIINNKKEKKSVKLKYLITTFVAVSAVIISIIALFYPVF